MTHINRKGLPSDLNRRNFLIGSGAAGSSPFATPSSRIFRKAGDRRDSQEPTERLYASTAFSK